MRIWTKIVYRIPIAHAGLCHGALWMQREASVLEGMKRNVRVADKAMQTARFSKRPDITETKIADVACECVAAQGAAPPLVSNRAFTNGVFPNDHIEGTKLCERDCLVMDKGGGRDDYSGYGIRMVAICSGSDEYSATFAFVQTSKETALALKNPGIKARGPDATASGYLTEAGFGEYFNHRTVHGLKTAAHEPPYLSVSSELLLDESMVFPIESGIYLLNRFGIRPYETVIFRTYGPEAASDQPRDSIVTR